ncbi:MAG: hypothetical protein EPO68_08095 [Planctomycetota bacterium]|nr:MAG: hypothetical protein EPO68_08095 [Planctomycetota bacterium]
MSAHARPLLACAAAALALALATSSCRTVKNAALDQVGNALAGSSSAWASDDDPELIRDAAPFSLKLFESLIAERPRHVGLRIAAAAGFAQYAYAFVEQDADFAEDASFARAEELRARARKLYLRARDHALAGLDARRAGYAARLCATPEQAAAELGAADLELAYWCAAPWGAAIALSKDEPARIAELPIVEALFTRALALDEEWGDGALLSAWIGLEAVRAGAGADALERSEQRYRHALEVSGGLQASLHVAFAEKVCVQRQDAQAFREALAKALSIDVDARPEYRLANVLAQRRARWLLAREGDLILAATP